MDAIKKKDPKSISETLQEFQDVAKPEVLKADADMLEQLALLQKASLMKKEGILVIYLQ